MRDSRLTSAGAGAFAILIGALLLTGCPRVVGPGVGDEVFIGAIQCGYCRTTPWCRTADSRDETPVYSSDPSCPGGPARERHIFGPDGEPQTLYCFGPAGTDRAVANPQEAALGPRPADGSLAPNSCFFHPALWAEYGPMYLGGSYDGTGCGEPARRTPAFTCNFDRSFRWADKLTCGFPTGEGKAAVIDQPIHESEPLVINVNTFPTREDGLKVGRSYLSAYAYTLTASNDVRSQLDGSGPLGDASGHVGYVCFMPDPGHDLYHHHSSDRAQPTSPDFIRGRRPLSELDHDLVPLLFDPGVDAAGFVFDIDPARSYLRYPDDGGAAHDLALTGTASGHRVPAPSTLWALTALHADAAGSAEMSVGKIGDGHVDLVDVWVGQHSLPGWAADRIEVPPSAARTQLNALVDSRRVSMDVLPTSAIVGTWSGVDAPTVSLDATFVDSGQTYQFHIVLVAQPRPSGTIASPPAGPVEIGCTNPIGETLDAAAGPTGFAGATQEWLLSGLPAPRGVSGPSATFAVPLRAPWDAPATLTYLVTAEGMVAGDTRSVRVVDRDPPTLKPLSALTPANLLVDCGWGDPAADNPTPRCLRLVEASTDKCSASHVVVESVQAYLGCSTTPVGPPQAPQDPKRADNFCIRPVTPPPGVSRNQLVYRVTYHAADAWNNRSAASQTVAFKVSDAASATCSPASAGRIAFPNACGLP